MCYTILKRISLNNLRKLAEWYDVQTYHVYIIQLKIKLVYGIRINATNDVTKSS